MDLVVPCWVSLVNNKKNAFDKLGFESSANFIEQQKPGVFPKTLRNMWVVVTIFNPTIAFLSACVLPLKEAADPNNPNILSRMGAVSAGRWLEILVIFSNNNNY